MVRFEDALDVRPLDDGKNWFVLEDFYYDTDVLLTPAYNAPVSRFAVRGLWRVVVPKGFITDFASIPRPLWAVVGGPADGKYRKIAVVHDYLYRTRGLATRQQADDVLREGMKFSGVGLVQRTLIYAGVRVGGAASYRGGL